LKTELEKKGVDTRGSKAELASRLGEADWMKKGLVTRMDVKNVIKKEWRFFHIFEFEFCSEFQFDKFQLNLN